MCFAVRSGLRCFPGTRADALYSVNIKPDSVSKSEPGLLTMQSVSEGGQAVAEFPSTSVRVSER